MIREENEIKGFIRRSQDKDPARRYIARSQFRKKYPQAYAEFKADLRKGKLKEGQKKSRFGKIFSTKIIERKGKEEES